MGYCTVREVEQVLGLKQGYFSQTSTPSISDVEDLIEKYTDYIERKVGFAWREKQANDGRYEYHTLGRLAPKGSWFIWMGYPVYLRYRKVRKFDKSKGDALEFFNGSEWVDFLTARREGTDGDYWVDYDNGIIYFRGLWAYLGLKEFVVRVKYRYGEEEPPQEIRLACAFLVAAHLLSVSDRIFLLPEGGTGVVTAREKIEEFKERAEEILERWKEYFIPGS